MRWISWLMLGLVLAGSSSFVGAEPPDEADPSGTPQQPENLQGTWRMVSLNRDGKKFDPNEFDDVRLIIAEDQYTYKAQDGKRQEGTFTVDTKVRPFVWQTTHVEEPKTGITVNRIYTWTASDSIKVCSPGPDEKTPDNFEAPAGSGRELAVWKKISD